MVNILKKIKEAFEEDENTPQEPKFETKQSLEYKIYYEIILSEDGKQATLVCKTDTLTFDRTYKYFYTTTGEWRVDPYYDFHHGEKLLSRERNENIDIVLYSGSLGDVYAFSQLKGIKNVKLIYKGSN